MVDRVLESILDSNKADISKLTITTSWATIDIGDASKFKLRNSGLVDIRIRTDTSSETKYWTVEPGEQFPPEGFSAIKNYQAKAPSATEAELIVGV